MFKDKPKFGKTKIVVTIVLALLVAGCGFLGFKYYQVSNQDVEEKNKKTIDRILDKVSQLYILPEGKEPTIAQIEDKSKLGDQPFFDQSKNGDYLLVYDKERLALIYREEVDKLVAVSTINTVSQSQTPADASEQADKPEQQ